VSTGCRPGADRAGAADDEEDPVVDFGKLAKKARGLVDEHGDQIAKAVDKATDAVDKKTKGKYADQLEKVDAAAEKLDKSARHDADDAAPDAPAPHPEAGTGA
jgi:hypothetical protein